MKAQKFIFTLLAGAAVMLVGCKESPYILPPGDGSHNQDTIYVAPDTPIPDSLMAIVKALPAENTYNVHEAYKLGSKLSDNETITGTYYIYGWVTNLHKDHEKAMTGNYGNGQFYIAANKDGMQDDSFYAYHVLGKDNKKFTNVAAVAVGDFVIIKTTKIQNYKGTIETSNNAAYVYYSTNPLW